MLDDAQLDANAAKPVDVAATMAILNDAEDELPIEAIRTVQRHPQLFIPHLIAAIRDATAAVRDGEPPSGFAHEFALILLTEFRAKEALPAIIEAITLPGEGPYELYDDSITEDLPTTLAVLAGDQLDLLDELICDRSLDEFVRLSVVNAVSVLARGGMITREEAAERLNRICRAAIDTQDYDLAIPLISNLCDLGVPASRELALEAFDKLEFDEDFSTRELVERDFAAAASGDLSLFERISQPEPRETVEYMSKWAMFTELDVDDDELLDDPDWRDVYYDDDADYDDEIEDDYYIPQPIHAPPKVGRNETCPCGSGKKYKKCCGRPGGEGLRLNP